MTQTQNGSVKVEVSGNAALVTLYVLGGILAAFGTVAAISGTLNVVTTSELSNSVGVSVSAMGWQQAGIITLFIGAGMLIGGLVAHAISCQLAKR